MFQNQNEQIWIYLGNHIPNMRCYKAERAEHFIWFTSFLHYDVTNSFIMNVDVFKFKPSNYIINWSNTIFKQYRPNLVLSWSFLLLFPKSALTPMSHPQAHTATLSVITFDTSNWLKIKFHIANPSLLPNLCHDVSGFKNVTNVN